MSGLPRRNAFTLVELLVAMVIISVIGSMLSIALTGAQRQAQETRSRAFIDRLNLLVLEIYEQESERRFPIPSTSVNQRQRNLTQLMWKRDWLRASLPDRISDIDIKLSEAPTSDRRSKPVQHLVGPPTPAVVGIDNAGGVPTGVPNTRDRRTARYQSRIIRTYIALGAIDPTDTYEVQWDAAIGLWTPLHQSAECLYLILATHTVNGAPASDTLRSRDIADTDGDGMPEIVDAWGTPVAFMRWPVGFYLSPRWNDPPTAAELVQLKQRLGRDPLDLLYSDPRYYVGTSPPANHEADDPFPVVPVVISAGGDRLFDLEGIDVPTTHNYKAMTRPVPTAPTGYSYATPFNAVDPFLAQSDGSFTPVEDQLGARRDTVETNVDNSGDNIVPALSFIQ